MRQEEHRIQCAIFKWFYYAYPQYRGGLFFAIPNGGHRNIQTAARLKAEGVTAGVSDLMLLISRHGYHALCVEVKTMVGRQSENQRSWQAKVESQGFKYAIVRSLDDFADLMLWYLNEPPKARIQGKIRFG